MAGRSKSLVLVLIHNGIVRRTKKHHETHFNELELSLSKHSSLEETLLLKTTTNILDTALNFLKSFNGSLPEKWAGFTTESLANIFPVLKADCYAFKEMINKRQKLH